MTGLHQKANPSSKGCSKSRHPSCTSQTFGQICEPKWSPGYWMMTAVTVADGFAFFFPKGFDLHYFDTKVLLTQDLVPLSAISHSEHWPLCCFCIMWPVAHPFTAPLLTPGWSCTSLQGESLSPGESQRGGRVLSPCGFPQLVAF